MSEYCGWPTNDDTACEHPSTEENGRCWQHADDARRGGRPTKFDDERARAAVDAARKAKSLRGCARAAMVTPPTIGNWLNDNPTFENADGELVEFFSAFMRARAQGESLLVEGGLLRDEIDSAHARFLLSTSFDYTEEMRIQVEEVGDGDAGGDVEELLAQAEDLF